MKQCVNGLFGFQFGNAGLVGETVDDIKFNQGWPPLRLLILIEFGKFCLLTRGDDSEPR